MEKPVKLLWTSGWDSTFRLLDLLLIKETMVEPHYIISKSRQSSIMEMQTMDKIKKMIFKKRPEAENLLLPTVLKERDKITIDPLITSQFNGLLAITHLGDQYVYLASYAKEADIEDLELAIHKDDQAHKFIEKYVVKESKGEYYKLKDNPEHSDLEMFKFFHFPILDYTKLKMEEIAIKNNFIDIMNETWFCHSPINGKACGVCNPCRTTTEEGMQHRLPFRGQIRYFTHFKVKPVVKKILQPLMSL